MEWGLQACLMSPNSCKAQSSRKDRRAEAGSPCLSGQWDSTPTQCLPTSQDFSAPASWGNNTLPAPKNGSLKGEPQINGTEQKLQKDSSMPKKVSSDKSGIRNQWVENKSNKWCLRNQIISTKRQVRVLSHIWHQNAFPKKWNLSPKK